MFLKSMIKCFLELNIVLKKIDDIEINYNVDYDKIKLLSDDSVPLNKLIYFPTITVVIRCVFKQNGVLYSQVYLDDCLYQI